MASHSKIALWAGSNAACPQGSPTTDSFKATLNKSQVCTRRASWIGDVCGVANPHMARICALRRLPHSGRATIAVPVQRSLHPRSHTGRRVASKATFRHCTMVLTNDDIFFPPFFPKLFIYTAFRFGKVWQVHRAKPGDNQTGPWSEAPGG